MGNPATLPGTNVPLLDLSTSTACVREDFLTGVASMLDSGAFTNGPAVAEFERAFAAYCGVAWCVGCASGLDALRLSLLAAGLEPGDEVVVPAYTFIATFEAVTQAGGLPVPADVTLSEFNVDPRAAEAAISSRTRILLPVHLYGQMADMVRLRELATRHDLTVLEDACQGHGAMRDGLRAGAAGFAGAFSFYPGKNLGAFGDAGALVTDDLEHADRLRALREHGQREKYRHESIGYTARLDTVQALALALKLPHLDGWNEERGAAAQFYAQALAGVGDLVLPAAAPGSQPVWHLYVVRTSRRDELAHFLRERGIGTGFHYPQPAHRSEAYARLGWSEGSFPITEQLARECVSLPLFPGVTEAQLATVVRSVEIFFARGG